tara:strand:+ start:1174 stop:2196 length:1023 start_codon:yes stop_codon:yes gene_type:complete
MTKEIKEIDPYKSAGVDIDAGNSLVENIKKDVASTHSKSVLNNIGGFAGMFELNSEYKNPVLVSCTDGVGTKVALAQKYKKLNGIGQDLVAMCVNDLIVCGAKPLFFLDYFASSDLDVEEASKIIKGIAKACIDSDCALLGGETAEMPGHYTNNNFDLAGFSVGCVEKDKIIDNSNVKEGDIIVGIESSGPHSNGYSLIRKILDESKEEADEKLIEHILKPTLLYPELISSVIKNYPVNAMAHITGGGLIENIPRSLPSDLCAYINLDSWEFPTVFKWIQDNGNLNKNDMLRIFNCGIGMVVIVKHELASDLQGFINQNQYRSTIIGSIGKNKGKAIDFI